MATPLGKSTSASPHQPAESRKLAVVKRLTVGITTTFNRCRKDPQMVLSEPSEAAGNNGLDNDEHDLIIHKGDIIGSRTSLEGPRCSMNPNVPSSYKVVELLGEGTFGQVARCINLDTNKPVAIKILKNHTAYFRQGLIEVAVLMLLNTFYDQNQTHKILRMYDHFLFDNHICIVTEILGMDLYRLMKENRNKGFSIRTIRKFLFQLLRALRTLAHANVVHCDVKPENVLLQGMTSNIKLIDFGSACFENFTMNTYIQSRHYRAPEIVLGLPYSCAIDMWSLGCIAAEFFLGLPLFAGNSEFNLLNKMIDMLGFPPTDMLDRGTKTKLYFDYDGSQYHFKSQFQFEEENNIRLPPNRYFFSYRSLKDLIEKNPMKVSANEVDEVKEIRSSLYDFLVRCLAYDPKQRLTPDQALVHPFILGEPLVQYTPPLRELEYKEYGQVQSCEGIEVWKTVFKSRIYPHIDTQLYYQIFMKALRNGHIINVLTESPFVGTITPPSLHKVFNLESVRTPKIFSTSSTPRLVPVTCNHFDSPDIDSSSPKSEKKKRSSIFTFFKRLSPSHSPRSASPRSSPGTSPRLSPPKNTVVSPPKPTMRAPHSKSPSSLTSSENLRPTLFRTVSENNTPMAACSLDPEPPLVSAIPRSRPLTFTVTQSAPTLKRLSFTKRSSSSATTSPGLEPDSPPKEERRKKDRKKDKKKQKQREKDLKPS